MIWLAGVSKRRNYLLEVDIHILLDTRTKRIKNAKAEREELEKV
jgi:hypothetical protein